jgi:hypothetical protein
MSEISDALEAWWQAARELEATTPWTADWQRARMVEEACRMAYQALARDWEDVERPARGIDVDTYPDEIPTSSADHPDRPVRP